MGGGRERPEGPVTRIGGLAEDPREVTGALVEGPIGFDEVDEADAVLFGHPVIVFAEGRRGMHDSGSGARGDEVAGDHLVDAAFFGERKVEQRLVAQPEEVGALHPGGFEQIEAHRDPVGGVVEFVMPRVRAGIPRLRNQHHLAGLRHGFEEGRPTLVPAAPCKNREGIALALFPHPAGAAEGDLDVALAHLIQSVTSRGLARLAASRGLGHQRFSHSFSKRPSSWGFTFWAYISVL